MIGPHSFRIRAWRKAGFVSSSRSYCLLAITFCRADQDGDTSPELAIGGCFTTTVCRAIVGVVAIVARQATRNAKHVAVLFMTFAPFTNAKR